MTRPLIPLITGLLAAASGILLYFFQLQSPLLKWLLYVCLAITMFLFELSILTIVLDQLSWHPLLAIILVLLSLSVFVFFGFAARTLYGDTLLYWLFGTVYPVGGGILYIVDILQKQ